LNAELAALTRVEGANLLAELKARGVPSDVQKLILVDFSKQVVAVHERISKLQRDRARCAR